MKLRAFGSKKNQSSTAGDSPGGDDSTADVAGSATDAQQDSGDPAGQGSGAQGSKNPEKKGRPTPKRRDQERARGVQRGPVSPPMTRKEAKERRKQNEAGMSKEEKKAHRAELKAERERRRQLMLEGDDRYVLARDRGDVRRFTRDYIDTHRRFINLFMPLAFALIVTQLVPHPPTQQMAMMGFWVFLVMVITDGVMVGRTVNAHVRERFPESDETGFGLGFYAAMRASQPRMLRTPRPRLKPGDAI